MFLASPRNVALTDIHIPVINGIYEIAVHFYTKQNVALAEHVVGHLFVALDFTLSRDDYYFRDLLRHVLDKLEILAPLAIVNESLTGRVGISSPLGKAYGLTNPQSLGYLFSKSTKFIKVDADREWVNPYHDFLEVMDLYWRHFP